MIKAFIPRSNAASVETISAALCHIVEARSSSEAVRWLAKKTIKETIGWERELPVDPFAVAQAYGVSVGFRRGGGWRSPVDLQVEAVYVDGSQTNCAEPIDSSVTYRIQDNQVEGRYHDMSTGGAEIHLRAFVDSETSRRRQRFTLAHELGHYVLRREVRSSFKNFAFKVSDAVEEKLCNTFAAELLMPPAQVKDKIAFLAKTNEFTAARWCALATDVFDVSLQSFAYSTHEVTRGAVQLVQWSFESGDAVPDWVSWAPNRRLRVAEPAGTGVYGAFVGDSLQSLERHEIFHLDGRRFSCFCSSLLLHKTRKVLSLLVPDPGRLTCVGIRADCLRESVSVAGDRPAARAGSRHRRSGGRFRQPNPKQPGLFSEDVASLLA
jgi:hypothetical protein